jgi:2-polyprenyl-3-methyl-5-hydroxy-6-metoxy-1,4-benzoquinol methylase
VDPLVPPDGSIGAASGGVEGGPPPSPRAALHVRDRAAPRNESESLGCLDGHPPELLVLYLEAFRGGASTLKEIELDLVGDVRGLDLLHLQCHFGLDSLSWARRGARVVGVDFSPRAIDLGRELAAETELEVEFHCEDVTSLPGAWND